MSDFKAKMNQIQFRLGLCPRLCWGSLQCTSDPLGGFKGPRGGEGRGEEWEGEREGEGGEWDGVGKGRKGRGRHPGLAYIPPDMTSWKKH